MAKKKEHDNLKQGVHCCYLLTYLIFQGKLVFWISTYNLLVLHVAINHPENTL